MLRRLLPLEALKSRNSFVSWPIGGGQRGRRGGREEGRYTGHGMVPTILGSDAAVAVAVEARHGRLGEEGEGFFED